MGGSIDVLVRRPRWWWLAGVPLLLAACNGDGTAGDDTTADGTAVEDTATDVTSTSGGIRPVPTVPPSTLEGQVDAGDGVVDASPTIAPVPVDPNAPTTSAVAPTTDLIGDPQPQPNSTSAPPPPAPTSPDDPDACERLADFDVVGVIADASGVTTTSTLVADEVCRYTSGGLVVEVHFVSIAEIRDDWFQRSGVEPVGEVGSDVVGLGSFVPPGSASATGYTIALEGGARGAVVAVTGTGDARLVAAQVAIFAGQSA